MYENVMNYYLLQYHSKMDFKESNTPFLAPSLHLPRQLLPLLMHLLHHGDNLLLVRRNQIRLRVVARRTIDGRRSCLVLDVRIVNLDHEVHDCRELIG